MSILVHVFLTCEQEDLQTELSSDHFTRAFRVLVTKRISHLKFSPSFSFLREKPAEEVRESLRETIETLADEESLEQQLEYVRSDANFLFIFCVAPQYENWKRNTIEK